jgi:hypothetical protein
LIVEQALKMKNAAVIAVVNRMVSSWPLSAWTALPSRGYASLPTRIGPPARERKLTKDNIATQSWLSGVPGN